MAPSLTALLKQYAIHPRKGFGQHFLVNTGVLAKIVRAVGPAPDEPLLEIGPGIGVLTRMLADAGAHVTAVETDRRMVEVLEAELGAHPRVRIVEGDILRVDLENLVRGSRFEVQQHRTSNIEHRTDRWRVVGNIPYNISSPILFFLRAHRHLFREAVLMLQREVADRLTARVGTKDYGLLTLGLGVVGTCKRLFDVAPGSFWPAPQVVSSVVRLSFPDPPPFPECNLAAFECVTRTAFGKRRKTIRNALLTAATSLHSRTCGVEGGTRLALPVGGNATTESGYPPKVGGRGSTRRREPEGTRAPEIDAALVAVPISPTQRPEQIPIGQFVDLTRHLGSGT